MRIKKLIAIGLVVTMLAGAVPRNLQAVSLEGATGTQKEVSTQEKSENREDVQLGSNKKTKLGAEGTTASTTASENATEGSNAGTTAGESTTEGNTAGTTAGENTTEGSTAGTTAGENTTEGSTDGTAAGGNTTEGTTTPAIENDYLDFLEVYQSAMLTGGAKVLTRQKELDQEFDAEVYSVDYGSSWTSSNFFVAAKLSDKAPENAVITLSAYDLKGEEKQVTVKPSTDKRRNPYRITSSKIFDSGKNGAQRAIYTVAVGTEEEKQVYKIIVNRVLEIASLSCYGEDELTSILSTSFAKEEKNYSGSVSSETKEIHVKASQQLDSDFPMSINDAAYEPGDVMKIPLEQEQNIIKIKLSQEGSYAGKEYEGKTYKSTGEYTITVTKNTPVNTFFDVNPERAIVCLYDEKGERVYPSEKDGHLFENLLDGQSYTYQVTCYGYKAVIGEFKAEPEQTIEIGMDSATYKHTALNNNEWWNYRNSEENNGITGASTPENAAEVSEKWAIQLSGEWSNSFTPPLILGGALYTASGKYVYKISKETGEILATSKELKGSMVFALNPLTYAEGMVFAQIGNGQIQALSATTLESVWISEPLGGQTLSPITYKNGYIYTGTWNSETSPGTYFCLSVTDEDPSKTNETKYCTWKYSHKGGFYWAGAYASDDYVIFGSDDGTQEGNYTNNSILYSVTAKEGILIDKIEGLCGDIRTSVTYHNGYVYVATKGGYLYRVEMNKDGTFGKIDSYNLGGMATASPLVYKNRIYIGVCGQGGQFNADGGHHFAVLEESSAGLSLAYTVPIKGYPQAAALLSTAYEGVDYNGDGKADGRVYVYFTYNAFPGGIVGFTDTPGQTEGTLETYFEPDSEKQQYCISPICTDSEGTLYYKNDSCYLMAVESNSAYLNDVTVATTSGEATWDSEFKRAKSEYSVKVPTGTESVTLTLDIPEGREVTVNGEACTGTYTLSLKEEGKATAAIQVSHKNKKKTYRIKVAQLDQNTNLGDMIISASNNKKEEPLGENPAFSPGTYTYTSNVYDGTKKFLNIFAKTENEDATMEMTAISGVKKITQDDNAAGSDGYTRFSVYFGDNEAVAEVSLTVTAVDGKTKQSYQITLMRKDVYAPNLTGVMVTRLDEEQAYVDFNANESGQYWYKMVEKGEKAPAFSGKEERITLNKGNNRINLSNLAGKGKDIYLMAEDTNGNVTEEPYLFTVKPYLVFANSIRVTPVDAKITVKDTRGNLISPVNGKWQWIDGNTYDITIEREGYETIEDRILADASVTEYTYEMKCIYSSNAYVKELYVTSSDKFGAGILKLSPKFEKDTSNYAASYGKERSYLNLWLKPEDEKAKIQLFAVSGIKGSTVEKDETITPEATVEGYLNWKVYFGKGASSAQVRVQVTAEDGTVKNYYVTLSMQDKTAPVLKRVSASRIASDKASVVFQTSEGGTYYYKVVKKGAKQPKISKKKGTDALAGTVTITLTKLSKGAKTIYIQLVDAAGNESNILKMDIPGGKASIQNDNLTGKDSANLTGKSSSDLTGKTSGKATALKTTSKDGDKNALKKNTKGKSGVVEQNHTKTETDTENSSNTVTKENEDQSSQDSKEGSSWNITGLDMQDPKNQLAAGVAGLGLLYVAFWQYSCHWYRRRKKEK